MTKSGLFGASVARRERHDKISAHAACFDGRRFPPAPVPEPHQAASGVADRVLRRDRNVPRCAGLGAAEASALGGAGLWVLYNLVNPLTMWLTFATFIGYAVIYTVLLKPVTPQNIVIGGASGAMPPVLGWAAATGDVTADALTLFLIIFAWTPPH